MSCVTLNNANTANGGNTNNDVLAPQNIALELEARTLPRKPHGAASPDAPLEGPLLLTLLLTNQSQNNNQAGLNTDKDTLVTLSLALGLPHSPLRLQLRGARSERQSGVLDATQMQFCKGNGYLVIPGALTEHEVSILLKETQDTATSLFTGDYGVRQLVFEPGQKSYISPVGRVLATLNRNGFNADKAPLQRIQNLGCGSLVIVKAADVGEKVVPHQDGCSGSTDPPSCVTFWYALGDVTLKNGCLDVAPGSRRTVPISRRCQKDATGKAEFVDLENPVHTNVEVASDALLPAKNDRGDCEYKNVEAKAGTLVLMHGNLINTSEANCSTISPVAFNFGIVEGTHPWREDNYLQPYEGETEIEKLRAWL
ncbi:hypothetical protein EK21DRAFT_112413 [Setomelanomma holmii]|uniref:Uncharacterized protein n=1 Tax=Setomelanomma holmii TaxID=210430 RepID=A0A9P4HA16_9PLEO|nr:hypothetical protein EK21DRAFT_112413 [Setomelanomma holmii]